MSDMYNTSCERLWEKIEFHRNKLDLNSINLKKMLPYDQLSERSPLIKELVAEVEHEFNYEMSEYQASWAVAKAKTESVFDNYNRVNKTTLMARK